jgi:DMSO/TMAO reductase YedYZ heme-binding membrane subunit
MRGLLTALAVFAAEALSRVKDWLTVRRVLGIVAFLLLLLCFRQYLLLGIDVTFLFGVDLGLIAEVSALMIVLSVRDHVVTAVHVVRRGLVRLKPVSRFLRRSVRRAFRSRTTRPRLPATPDDAPGAFALA